jgi:hypothetical protein
MEKVGMWELMMVQLTGHTIDNFKLHEVAKTMTGDVKQTKQYLKLTETLWKPTAAEKFDQLVFGCE